MRQRWKKVVKYAAMWTACLVVGFGVGTLGAHGLERLLTPAYETGDYRALYTRAGLDVVLFSTTTCPHCRDLRAWLDEHAIAYRDYAIDGDPDAQKLFDSLGGGPVPQLFVGERRIVGNRPDIVDDALDARAGVP